MIKLSKRYLCEDIFFIPESPNSEYSLIKCDIYSRTPNYINNHSLTLLKNLKKGEYELIKCYWQPKSSKATIETFWVSNSFLEILINTNKEYLRYWGKYPRLFIPCEHIPEKMAWHCEHYRLRHFYDKKSKKTISLND